MYVSDYHVVMFSCGVVDLCIQVFKLYCQLYQCKHVDAATTTGSKVNK